MRLTFNNPIIQLLALFCFVLLISNCSSGPETCPECNQTGKIIQSIETPMDVIIESFNVANNVSFNPDYQTTVKVKNNSTLAGNVTIYVDYEYKGMETQTKKGELFIDAQSSATITMRYDADGLADDFSARVVPQMLSEKKEIICPTCNGTGMINN
jgi:hypothetical protein